MDTFQEYNYSSLPEDLQDGMKRYLEYGVRAGGFLTACLENDLVGAVNKADKNDLPRLKDIVKWIYWETPDTCWGSKAKVAEWLGRRTIGDINKDIRKNLVRIAEEIEDDGIGTSMSHECEVFVSMCCGVGAVEETDYCGSCHKHTGFECEECGYEQS